MMQRRMFLYPWDVQEEGPAVVTDRLIGAGISSVAVATSYHAGKFLRPHAPARKVYYPEDGTVYFTPDPALYGPLKPMRAALARDFDVLAELSAAATALGRAGWTVGLHNSRLGRMHPDLVCLTAFGDPIWSSLCPAQPEVREYLVALCVDQARNCPVEEICIEAPGYQTYRHNDHHEFELIDLTPRAASLLGLCFCPACRAGAQAAGVDSDRLAQAARQELEAFFEIGEDRRPDLIDDPEWQGFLIWRCEVVASLVASVRASLPPETRLSVIPTVRTPLHTCWREGADLARLSRAADRVAVPIYREGSEATAREMAEARRLAGPGARLGFILRPSWPTLTSPAALDSAMAAAKSQDAEQIEFYNYGHLPLRALDWIEAAAS